MDKTFPEIVRKTILSKRRNDGPIVNVYEGYFHLKVLIQRLFETIVDNEQDTEAISNVFVHVAALCQGVAEDLMYCPVDSITDEMKERLHTERQLRIEQKLTDFYARMALRKRPLSQIQKGEAQRYSLEYTEDGLEDIEEALE